VDIFAIFTIFGGLGLFIFGMKMMSDGLQHGAGSKLRDALSKLTKNQFLGLIVGSIVATLIHSSATTVMIVGFINAGLISLVKSVGMMLGANVGTTFSMQLVSFDLSKYAPLAVAIGMLMYIVSKKEKFKYIGYILLGFGVLFIGMTMMKEAVKPLRSSESFQALISHTDGSTILGMFIGILVGVGVTLIIQSSGATVGMLFALSSTGVFTEFSQVFPLVLGAQIGTCITAILGSIGTSLDARRSAFSHLFFNIFGAIFAVVIYKVYYWGIPAIGGDLTRQIANFHTIVQIVNAFILLPFAVVYIKFIKFIVRGDESKQEITYLEPKFLDTPEMAVMVAIKELKRVGLITRKMLQGVIKGFLKFDDALFTEVLKSEEAVDNLKLAVNAYVSEITKRKLSKRQSIIVQQLTRAIANIERVGDHIENLVQVTRDKVHEKIWFSNETMQVLIDLYLAADKVLVLTYSSLNPEEKCNEEYLKKYNKTKDEFFEKSEKAKKDFNLAILERKEDARAGLFFARYVDAFDKVVKHAKNVIELETDPLFYIKSYKYTRKSEIIENNSSNLPPEPFPFDEKILHINDDLLTTTDKKI